MVTCSSQRVAFILLSIANIIWHCAVNQVKYAFTYIVLFLGIFRLPGFLMTYIFFVASLQIYSTTYLFNIIFKYCSFSPHFIATYVVHNEYFAHNNCNG